MQTRPIGIFDSGIGGLSVLEECRKHLKNEDFLYLSDKEFAPYGDKTNFYIQQRVFACSERLIKSGAKAIVVACNTATGVGIKKLREKYACPFVGLEPALKPAFKRVNNGKILLLCTEATTKQDNVRGLISKLKIPNLVVAPQKKLASLVEGSLNCFIKGRLLKGYIEEVLMDYEDVEAVVLGCTHFVFIRDIICSFFLRQGKEVAVLDGNDGAARRLTYLLTEEKLLNPLKKQGKVEYLC